MIRALLLAAILLLPSMADARPRQRHDREVVQIVDHTDATWTAALLETIDDFNRVMPPSGPLLRYERGAVGCAADTIPVCSGDTDPWAGFTWWWTTQRYAQIEVKSPYDMPWDMERVLCHEFMHALTHIGDNYGAVADSCVWGYLSDPGRWDITYLYKHFGDTPPHQEKAKAKHKKPCKGIKNKQNRVSCQRNHRR
jgi:hypothetical protein